MKALTTACETLVSNTGENKYTISIESGKVIVSSDRNSKWFERTFFWSIVPGNEHEYFEYSEIGLDEELLIVKNGIGIRTPEPLNNLCTLYDYKAYFEDIQLSHHVFKNSENLTDRHSSEPLEQLVKVHKNPITGRWENSNIETENFVNAVYRDREFSTLGMFREITTFKMPDGRRIKECEIYPSGIQYPEIIYFDEPEKAATYDFKTQKYYDKEQNKIDEQELTHLLNQRYLQGLETSKTKEYSPQTYQRILEYIRGNIFIHKEKMEIIKTKIAPELLANPVFIREFNRACEMIFKMTGENACDVQISEDGKMITIVQENTKNIQCQNQNNHYFIATNITLDDEQLNVEQCRGTLYKNENDTSGYVVDAYYTDEVYDEKGIQLKHSWYED